MQGTHRRRRRGSGLGWKPFGQSDYEDPPLPLLVVPRARLRRRIGCACVGYYDHRPIDRDSELQSRAQPGETLYLVIYADRPFISSAGIPIQAGSPANGRWYKRVTCSVVGTDVTIPSFTLDSTTDAQDIPGKAARYSAYFYANTRNLGQYGGFESFRLLPVYTNPTPTDATWAQIRADNTTGAVMSIDRTTLTSEQINRLVNDLIATSGGVTTIEGQAGPTITITDDTNVTITGSGNVLTVGWAGTLAVAARRQGGECLRCKREARSARRQRGEQRDHEPDGSDYALTAHRAEPDSARRITTPSARSSTRPLRRRSPSSSPARLATSSRVRARDCPGLGGSSGNHRRQRVFDRVTFWSGAATITSDSNFLFDSTNDRLSLGTTLATNTLNLPNAGYVGGSNAAGLAIIRAIGVNASDYVSIARAATARSSVGVVTQDITGPSDFSAPDTALFHSTRTLLLRECLQPAASIRRTGPPRTTSTSRAT